MIVLLIVGLVIGAGVGWFAKPAPPLEGVSEEVHNTVVNERDSLLTQVEELQRDLEDLTRAQKVKAAFIYVGPIGDYGWSHAHDEGRLYVESKFPWLETAYSESA
jgi:simple sugar transport system substrate-binding protein